jgi:hypothetical protein
MTDFFTARQHVQELLNLCDGNADQVYRAIRIAQSTARYTDDYTELHMLAYGLQKLALADLTGDRRYRL